MISRPPIDDWPHLDRTLWKKGLEPLGLFDNSPGARWSEITRYNVACVYGRWLSFLAKQGSLDPNVSPADRATRELVAAYIADLRD
jgi:hypothetical protein